LRAATEFIGALGANVGAGMLLREGTRSGLKFFPGWGMSFVEWWPGRNLCDWRASTVFLSRGRLAERRAPTYLASRKKPRLLTAQESEKTGKPKKIARRTEQASALGIVE